MRLPILTHIVIILLCFDVHIYGQSQVENDGQKEEVEVSKREEIQRYFGYEDLLYRYLTVPYDVSAGVNQQGRYVDIGFVFLAISPLLILLMSYRKKRLFYGMLVLICIYLSICLRFSFLVDSAGMRYYPSEESPTVIYSFNSFGEQLMKVVYDVSMMISTPVVLLTESLTGNKDHITYPVMAILFLGVLLLVVRQKNISRKMKFLFIVGYGFSTMWWWLSGGIIWYGFIMLFFGWAFILKSTFDKQIQSLGVFSFSSKMVVVILTFWIVLVSGHRISNINAAMSMDHPDMGKMIVDPKIITYSLGMYNKEEILALSAQNINTALQRINSDTTYIYMVGTSLAFEIKDNPKRILDDYTLKLFQQGSDNFTNTKGFVRGLRANGYRYIVIDLLLPSLDNTPEGSLREKYRVMMTDVLYDTELTRLIATDRIVRYTDANGQTQQIPSVFGQDIVSFGTYAVYEIL